jgi:hypothetical protein
LAGDAIFVSLTGGLLVPAMITLSHAVHDRFRVAVTASRLPEDLDLGIMSLAPPRAAAD